MDTAQLSFDITVTVQSNTSAVAETLHLGPTEPFSSTLDARVNVQLLGDLSTYKSMPDFSSYYLMIPSPTGALTAWVLTNESNGNIYMKHRLATRRAYQHLLEVLHGNLSAYVLNSPYAHAATAT